MPQPPTSAAVVAPNLYQLTGAGISINYIPSGAGGQPFFTYQDLHRTLHFFGKEIQQAEVADLGTVVSVTLVITIDLGSTTFSVLLPRVNLPDHLGASAFIRTEGITTVHSLSFAPGVNLGQRDTYTVAALSGTASLGIVPL
jgi:hypothetical protein